MRCTVNFELRKPDKLGLHKLLMIAILIGSYIFINLIEINQTSYKSDNINQTYAMLLQLLLFLFIT